MVIRATAVKSLLWFCATVFSALSFPIQVYTKSPYPSLIPYILIALIIVLTLSKPRRNKVSITKYHRRRNIGLMVNVYLFLLVFNTWWQILFGEITITQGVSAFIVYLLPVVFYFYFRKTASEQEIRSVFLGIVVAGLISGIFFAYDSFLKLALDQVSDYANEAFQYSLDRADQVEAEANDARARSGWRSFGLLESHSVSGGYLVLATFAALALLPMKKGRIRLAVVAVSGTLLLMGLNFTSIIAFSVTIFLFEFQGQQVFRGRLSGKSLNTLITFPFMVVLIAVMLSWLGNEDMLEYMLYSLSSQKDLALGSQDSSMVGLFIEYLEKFFQNIADNPIVLLTGDGFSKFGMIKGGDIGLVESMAKFGVPFFLAIMVGYFLLIKSGLRQIDVVGSKQGQKLAGLSYQSMIQFAICVTLLVFITEGHYSIWAAKSILPIVFLSLALFERYLPTHDVSMQR
ncbi:MAG: hypothetical protein WCP96_02015 [Methylococcaceae bacterium]